MQNHYERVSDPADTRRCQKMTRRGQCELVGYQAVEDGPRAQFCLAHNGAMELDQKEKKVMSNYNLGKYQQQVDEKAGSSTLKSLRDEIAIMRILLQTRMLKCKDDHDLMLHSGPLADLALKIDKVVNSCHRLDEKLGVMLDQTQAIQWATEIVEIVARHVEDEDAVRAIADEIQESLTRLSQPKIR